MWSSHICSIKQILFPPDREIQAVDAAKMDICIHVLDKQTGLVKFCIMFDIDILSSCFLRIYIKCKNK